MKFVVYNADGEILRTGSCPDGMLDIQAHALGEFVLEGEANDETDTVDPVNRLILKNARTINQ